jgi:hypothetical protein
MNKDLIRAYRRRFWALLIVGMAIAGTATAWLIINAPVTLIKRHYSCKDCRTLRCVAERSRFGFRLSQSETLDARTPIPEGHLHQWWKYHTYTESGWGKTWTCGASRYEDGSDD